MLKDEFLGLIFGDKRLNNRCENILDLLTENPRMSFSDAAGNWSQLKGLYRFFANTNVTKENLMNTHIKKLANVV